MAQAMVSHPGISSRPYQAGDESGVLLLLRQSLGSGRAFDRTSAFWQWKHFRGPFGPSLLLVATDDRGDQIVGLRAFMRWRFHDGTRTVSAVRAVDTATHPGHRRSGVFSRLTEAAVERARDAGVDLIFNTPNQISRAGYLKLGWTDVGRPCLLIKILRPLRIARTLAARGTDGDGRGPTLGPPIASVEALLSDEAWLESLLREDDRRAAGRLRTPRTSAFLRWRYAEIPGMRYHAYWQQGPGGAKAAVVLRANRRRRLGEIVVCELLIGDHGAGVATALLRNVARATDADYLVAHAPGRSVQARALVRAGFLPIPRLGPHFTVRPLSPAAREMGATRLSAWHLSLGDLEVF